MRSPVIKLGFAFLVAVAGCQGPDEYSWGPRDAGGIDGPVVSGQGGTVTGLGGNLGTGGQPTGLGGSSAGTNGSAGTTGNTGTAGSAVGTAGTNGTAGTSGIAGTNGRGGTTGNAGTNGRGGTTGNAGTNGRGGTTGNAGTNGAAGGTVLYSDNFESNSAGATMATGWTRMGGSSGDWVIASDGSNVLQQEGSTSSTVRMQSATGASGSPWSGAVSASARVKMIMTGSNNQAALLCVRYNDTSNRYCGAVVPGGVQILTVVGGSAGGSAVFSASVSTGTFYDLRISVDASNVLTIYLGGTQRGTYTPGAMTNGTVAVGTASMQAAFDNISVTRP